MKNESYIDMNLLTYFNFSQSLQIADNLLSNETLINLSMYKEALYKIYFGSTDFPITRKDYS